MNQQDTRAQWVDYFEASGLTQGEFQAKHGIPARTLRSWRKKYRASRQPPAEQVQEVIDLALAALVAARRGLEARGQEAAVGEPPAINQGSDRPTRPGSATVKARPH